MCTAPKPHAPAPEVPLPEETVKPTVVDTGGKKNPRRSGRSVLTVPTPARSGMSGLNIPS